MANRRVRLFVFLIIGLVLVAGVGWWGFTRLWRPRSSSSLRGSSGSSGQLGVSGGNLVVVGPRPGIFFGTVRKPGSPEQFTYLILFRYGRPAADGSSRGIQFRSASECAERGNDGCDRPRRQADRGGLPR